MAYVTNEKTKQVRNDLKKAFPTKAGWKFSVRKLHHSNVDVAIMAAPIDWEAHLDADHFRNRDGNGPVYRDEKGILRSHSLRLGTDERFTGEAAVALKKIVEIILVGHWDKSDSQSDYFHTAFYWDLSIGRYDKPFTYTGNVPTLYELATVAVDEVTAAGSEEEEEEHTGDELATVTLAAYEVTATANVTVCGVGEGYSLRRRRRPQDAEVATAIAEEWEVMPDVRDTILGAIDRPRVTITRGGSKSSPVAGNLFAGADVVSTYTRSQALADGLLVDASGPAREAGIIFPVALSRALWADVANIGPASKVDFEGRLWDVLYMFALRARQLADKSVACFTYDLLMQVGQKKNYTVKAHVGPGDKLEPVITLMKPGED